MLTGKPNFQKGVPQSKNTLGMLFEGCGTYLNEKYRAYCLSSAGNYTHPTTHPWHHQPMPTPTYHHNNTTHHLWQLQPMPTYLCNSPHPSFINAARYSPTTYPPTHLSPTHPPTNPTTIPDPTDHLPTEKCTHRRILRYDPISRYILNGGEHLVGHGVISTVPILV